MFGNAECNSQSQKDKTTINCSIKIACVRAQNRNDVRKLCGGRTVGDAVYKSCVNDKLNCETAKRSPILLLALRVGKILQKKNSADCESRDIEIFARYNVKRVT